MRDLHSAPPVVVGVDGSPDASTAAVWAVDEAASRNLPLKLVYVIYQPVLPGADACHGPDPVAAANVALSEARSAVAAAEPAVTVQTEVLWGNPLTTLIGLSRSATMLCTGSVGIEHTCHQAGSTAAALAGSAGCPVAVIHPRQAADTGYIVAEVDATPENNDVLGWAMAEARLRRAPVRVITAEAPDPAERRASPAARLHRRLEHWATLYPDVTIDAVTVPSVAEYLAENAASVRLFVSATRDRRSIGEPVSGSGCSVLTVSGQYR